MTLNFSHNTNCDIQKIILEDTRGDISVNAECYPSELQPFSIESVENYSMVSLNSSSGSTLQDQYSLESKSFDKSYFKFEGTQCCINEKLMIQDSQIEHISQEYIQSLSIVKTKNALQSPNCVESYSNMSSNSLRSEHVTKRLYEIILDFVKQLKSRKRIVTLPIGRKKNSVYRTTKNIARCIFLINCILQLQKNKCSETKRDIFYQNKLLFDKQSVVDLMIDDVACTIGVSRRHLNVVAPNKGEIAGDIQLTIYQNIDLNSNGTNLQTVDVKHFSPYGYSIHPNIDMYIEIKPGDVNFVLVIEKDAIFSRLVRMRYYNKAKCLLITGKGYPDIGTSLLLSRISKEYPAIPIFCLTDADPFGVEIYLSYKYGSFAMQHQNYELTVTNMEWIGLKPSDFDRFEIPSSTLISMGSVEMKKAIDVKRRLEALNEPGEKEVGLMLQFGKKAEIEALCSKGFMFLVDTYIPTLVREYFTRTTVESHNWISQPSI